MQNPLDDVINELKKAQEKGNKTAQESDDVKSGKSTVEEELKEPGYVLYNQICENSIKILQSPTLVDAFKKIGESVGEDIAKSLVEIMAISMSHSAHEAIVFYDELLKAELTKQFDNIGTHINMMKAEIQGQTSAMKVFRKELSEFTNNVTAEEFKKKNGINE